MLQYFADFSRVHYDCYNFHIRRTFLTDKGVNFVNLCQKPRLHYRAQACRASLLFGQRHTRIFFLTFDFDNHIIKMFILPTLRGVRNNLRHRNPDSACAGSIQSVSPDVLSAPGRNVYCQISYKIIRIEYFDIFFLCCIAHYVV